MNAQAFLSSLGLSQNSVAEILKQAGSEEKSTAQERVSPSNLAVLVLTRLYPTGIVTEGHEDYSSKTLTNWSTRSRLKAPVIFLPTSAAEVAKALQVVEYFKVPFTIKSGGHAPYPFWSSCEEGILFSLEKLNQITLGPSNELVKIGAGCRWRQIYESLASHNLTVTGGRYGDVGCGGLLTGFGTSPLLGSAGFSADNIVSYEVVVSNGRIINANKTENSDLFWALKGCSNNFGIVTQFEMVTIDLPKQILSGNLVYSPDKIPAVLEALVDFQESLLEEARSELGPTIIRSPGSNMHIIAVDTFSKELETAFMSKFMDLEPLQSSVMPKTFLESRKEVEQSPIFASGFRYNYGTLTIRPSKALYKDIVNIFDEIYSPLLQISGLTLTLAFQAVPVSAVRAGIKRGGNPTGLAEKPQLILCLDSGWADADDDEAMLEADKTFISRVEQLASAQGLLESYLWMNNAGTHQDVIASYGAENSSKLRGISQKYDPDRVFQNLCRGGFKLTK